MYILEWPRKIYQQPDSTGTLHLCTLHRYLWERQEYESPSLWPIPWVHRSIVYFQPPWASHFLDPPHFSQRVDEYYTTNWSSSWSSQSPSPLSSSPLLFQACLSENNVNIKLKLMKILARVSRATKGVSLKWWLNVLTNISSMRERWKTGAKLQTCCLTFTYRLH